MIVTRKIAFFFLIFLFPLSVFAEESSESPEPPWFTGPLFAPPGVTVEKGHMLFQPYFSVDCVTGIYDSNWDVQSFPTIYSINPELIMIFGVAKRWDIATAINVFFNIGERGSTSNCGDLVIGPEYQLVKLKEFKRVPAIKLAILETLPTGKFDNLDIDLAGIDATGRGTFGTDFNIVFYQIYDFGDPHYLSATLSLEYFLFSSTHVRGLNAFGGAPNTNGTVFPGDLFRGILSFEYKLDKNWGLALDNIFIHTNRDRFTGQTGFVFFGIPAVVGKPSSELIAFAPALEYNFNDKMGIIGGVFFTGWGRNSLRVRTGLISFVLSF